MTMTIVWTNGCFDLLHQGHVHILKESKRLGDKLVVGLNTDRAVRKLKGINRPIETYEVRKTNLLKTGYVDEVVPIGLTPINGILKYKPDIITKGDDYQEKDVIGYGKAEIRIIKRIPGYSTSKILQTKGS
jgi:D-beta-D-heptose 7-phosphate kinase/D-beta-D-heptose 1-phosphate adenosyltransferase